MNMKKRDTSRYLWCYKGEENFHTKRVTKKFFVTMTTNIAREEHTKHHKENDKRVK